MLRKMRWVERSNGNVVKGIRANGTMVQSTQALTVEMLYFPSCRNPHQLPVSLFLHFRSILGECVLLRDGPRRTPSPGGCQSVERAMTDKSDPLKTAVLIQQKLTTRIKYGLCAVSSFTLWDGCAPTQAHTSSCCPDRTCSSLNPIRLTGCWNCGGNLDLEFHVI